jgi:hypothetical protein
VDRLSHSFELVGQSYRLLLQDKELFVLPLCSGILCLAIVAGVATGFGLDARQVLHHRWNTYLPLFLIYFATNTVGIFFQSALVAAATERLRGGDATLRSAFRAATNRLGHIIGWAALAATVGVILRIIQDRVGGVGKIVVGLIGATWSIATFFIVPVLVLEDRSVLGSLQRSASVLKDTWGESLIVDTGMGFASFTVTVALAALAFLFSTVAGGGGMAFFVCGFVVQAVFFSALQGVFVASLYRYATHDGATPFQESALAAAFRPKQEDTDEVTRLFS